MPRSILVADDSVTIRKVIGMLLSTSDFSVIAVDNGADAISKARETSPDLVLVDCVMPGKNGYEVCEALKADPSTASIPVLLLAGIQEPFDEARARAANADGHIAKPFDSTSFLDRVKTMLGLPADSAIATGYGTGMTAAYVPPQPQAAAAPPPQRPFSAPPQQAAQPQVPSPQLQTPQMPPPRAPAMAGAAPGMQRPTMTQSMGVMSPTPARPPPPMGIPPGARAPMQMGQRAPMQGGMPQRQAPSMPMQGAPMARQGMPPPMQQGMQARPQPGFGGSQSGIGMMPQPQRAPQHFAQPMPIQLNQPVHPHGAPMGYAQAAMPQQMPPQFRQPGMQSGILPPMPQPGRMPQQMPQGRPPSDGGEALLREALARASKEVIERIVWEVVPQLAETIIRENLDRLLAQRPSGQGFAES